MASLLKFEDALVKCYKDNYTKFVSIAARKLSGDRNVAEEAVQEGFLKAITYKHKWRKDGDIFYWLRRIISNTAKDAADKERMYGALEGDIPEPVFQHGIDKTEIKDWIDEYATTELQREVLYLRFVEGMSVRDIPSFSSATYGTVRVVCHQFLKRINEA